MKILLIIAFACIIGFVHALECYNCIYYPGNPNSKDNCKNNPKDLVTCPNITTLYQNDPQFLGRVIDDGSTRQFQNRTVVCGKGWNKDYVIRGCAIANASDVGHCNLKNYQWEIGTVYLPLGDTCLCNSNKCNEGTNLSASTGLMFMAFGVFSYLYNVKDY